MYEERKKVKVEPRVVLSDQTLAEMRKACDTYGCYMMLDVNLDPYYVGESNNVADRLEGHEKMSFDVAHVAIFPTKSSADRGWMEKFLISYFHPEMNREHKLMVDKPTVCLLKYLPKAIVVSITWERDKNLKDYELPF